MRLERLELIRYGMFTGQAISLPRAERDFHMIVGANETGKSTVRSAISDLLYGFPKTPSYAFLHPTNELRLGAIVDHAGQRLDFHRTKGIKRTLRAPSDVVLAETALSHYLGTGDRSFFEQMFGLDHKRLVDGGHSILSASNDVGQILFESASGVAGLSSVRVALDQEAEKLWSPRRSKERIFYSAQDEYDQAISELKNLTVRAKDWAEKAAEVERLEEALEHAQRDYVKLDEKRFALERIRRVAPHLRTLRAKDEELRQLGAAIELPEDAARTLHETEIAIAQAKVLHDSYASAMKEAEDNLAKISFDPAVLALAEDINALNDQRVQFRAHEGDIQRRQAEVATQWKIACDAATGLKWNMASEDELIACLPSLIVRKSLERLIRERGAVEEALHAARKAESIKANELSIVSAQLAQLPIAETPLGLRAALTEARKLGDSTATRLKKETELAERNVQKENALLALGTFRADIEVLRAMTVPSVEIIQSHLKEQSDEDAEARAVAKQLEDRRNEVKLKELEVSQYRKDHDVVTRDQVLEARRRRDVVWTSFKNDYKALQAQASSYEQFVVQADEVADRRESTVQEASELQSKLNDLERLRTQVAGLESDEVRLRTSTTQRAMRFEQIVTDCGLSGMRPSAITAWIDARISALEAVDAALEAERALRDWDRIMREAASVLSKELVAAQQPVDPAARLETLVLQASEYIKTIDAACVRRLTLEQHESEAKGTLSELVDTVAAAQTRMNTWQMGWEKAVAQSGIFPNVDVGQAEGALELIKRIDEALGEMRNLRSSRIEPMRKDLAKFADEANRLARVVDGSLVDRTPAEIALSLASRLQEASKASEDSARYAKDALNAKKKAEEASLEIDSRRAVLRPLLERANVGSLAELRNAIDRSDERRRILQAIRNAEKGLVDEGDGLTREQLETEVDAADLANLTATMNAINEQINALLDQQKKLSAEMSIARADLEKIAGADDAAKWEAKRQEALAKMSDAIGRHIKVATAAYLLKWSIERYRETKQGPMLRCASAIFSKLTLGSFELLTVDFEHEPPRLQGKRPGGELVDVEGMSDGTRDQLYLALRLAALDMHLDRAHTLPFIADDLVINFDDKRSRAAIEALGELSRKTQVVFLTHHDHLLPIVRAVLGNGVNVVEL